LHVEVALLVTFVVVVLLLGGFCQGSTGFGFGLLCIGLLTIFFSVIDSLLIISTLTLIIASSILYKYRQYVEIKSLLKWFLPAAIMGRILAFGFLHSYGDTSWIKQLLGIFLFVMLAMLIWQKLQSKEQLAKLKWEHPGFAVASGFLASFIGGSFAIGGPFLVIYFLMKYQDKKHYIANLQAVFSITCLMTLLLHLFSGDYTLNIALYTLLGIPAVLIGSMLGGKLFSRLPLQKIQYFAYGIVFLAALNAVMFPG